MEHQDALRVLRIQSENPSDDEIIKAYTKLSRRYPRQEFPEKHAAILEARDILLRPDLSIQRILFEDEIEFSWLKPHIKSKTLDIKPLSEEQKSLQEVLRPAFHGAIHELMEEDIDSIFSSMPRELAEELAQKMEEFMARKHH